MEIYDLRINSTSPCLCTPVSGLRFSWKIKSDKKNVMQESYRITLSRGGKIFYDSGIVLSDESAEVKPSMDNLPYDSDCIVSVSVTDNYGDTASLTEDFRTEPGEDGFGGALWIRPKKHISGWAPYLRTKFYTEDKPISRALLYGVGLGIGEWYINNERTDDYYLDPPATNYEKEILYRGYDVTKLIKNGLNCLCVQLGEGFYSQSRVWGYGGMPYGAQCAKARLTVEFEDGSTAVIVTDTDNWKYRYGPISTNNIYGGEIYDSRLEVPDFASPDGDDEDWESVIEDTSPKGILKPCLMEPVRIVREIPCVGYHDANGRNDGAWIFDLGENYAGIYEIKFPPYTPRGAVHVIRTAETLDANGKLDFRSIGAGATQCIQQEVYIARGGDPEGEVYRPRFTYHGFRFVEITGIHDFSQGYGTEPKPSMIKGYALSTGFKRTGFFKSSNEDLNRLDKIMHNTYLSNYHGYPEDCPAREKCGWLGDAEVVCNWGLYNYDSAAAYEKYLSDIRTSKEVYGTWQMIAPGKRTCGEASPLWGCAQIIVPYYMWKYRGMTSAVSDNIDLMREWVEHELNRSKDYIISEGLGDWDPIGGNENPRRMPVPHSSTMMFYEITAKMAEISDEFGYGDGDKYRDLADKIKDAIINAFYDKEKHTYGYWGSNGVALKLGIYPDGDETALVESTVSMIKADNYAMSTAIYGNKYLVPMLFDYGYGDIALKYLFTRDVQSFGVTMDDGATSMWEEPDMKFAMPSDRPAVSSYNHPMHGGFMYSYYEYIAGIRPTEPGFKEFIVEPCLASGIDSVDVSFECPYGVIRVAYDKGSDGKISYSITVPENTSCIAILEGMEIVTVGSGEWIF